MIKKIGLVLLIFVGFLTAVLFLGVPAFISRINTRYVPGYSQEKLYSVKEGMTEREVDIILGIPFSKHTVEMNCSIYSEQKNELSEFIGWEAATVCYTKDNIVTAVVENIFYN